ncbi:hypothetical protein [Mycolicibacterium phocaicum]|uniref:Uncharacterized protein n=1 Tax=Mycolicibacterium phocaicum TaxID=319706 RepID=A0A7I7ZHU4_9MYCO|nr:hypothetical protein [Mycolicibacterium phocaicum]TLH63688.1 hypothetical protein C1S79_21175 [Mycolicibacterium phocaicum]BBZ53745.1 hypothetical protein MPHO_07370 [Mycolicibacterium phocaicum]
MASDTTFRYLTRRAALAALGVGAVAGLAYAVLGIVESPRGVRLTDGAMMGVGGADMARYMEMFARHTELRRTVEDIPGGVRTTTESGAPELAAQLKAHVASMYTHVDQGNEVMCMSESLPTLFRHAGGYRRQLSFTDTGVVAEETSDDPAITDAIRAHAREVSGFVRDGMPAGMRSTMGDSGSMMGPGPMMGPGGH